MVNVWMFFSQWMPSVNYKINFEFPDWVWLARWCIIANHWRRSLWPVCPLLVCQAHAGVHGHPWDCLIWKAKQLPSKTLSFCNSVGWIFEYIWIFKYSSPNIEYSNMNSEISLNKFIQLFIKYLKDIRIYSKFED